MIIILIIMIIKNTVNFKLKRTLNLLDNKFKFEIIYLLLSTEMRFGEIKFTIDLITQQLLTKILRELENDNLILRKKYSGFPRKVVYSLTPFGRSLNPIIKSLLGWEEKNSIKINNQIKKRKLNSLYDYY